MGLLKNRPRPIVSAPAIQVSDPATSSIAAPAAALPVSVALQLGAAGYRVAPLPPKAKKTPPTGFPTLPIGDLELIKRWEAEWPGRNYAIVTGETATPDWYVFVLDIDGENGRRTLELLEAEHGALPVTCTVTTGRPDGGEHRYFKVRGECTATVGAGQLSGLGEGLDYRCRGGYAVALGAVHPSGAIYAADRPLPPVAELPTLPDWILNGITRRKAHRGAAGVKDQDVRSADWMIKLVEDGVDLGGRNDALARLAGYLFRVEAFPPRFVAALLHCVNESRFRPEPLSTTEVDQTVNSIAAKEAQRIGSNKAMARAIEKASKGAG
jgi:hypothetical protein